MRLGARACVAALAAALGCTPILGADWDRPLRTTSENVDASPEAEPACDGGSSVDGECVVTCAPPAARCGARCCSSDMLALGRDHTCAITETGGIKCWGGNSFGQLGDDTTDDRLRPVDVADLAEPVVQVTAGADFTCARTASGVAKCWGQNFSGQLGNGAIPSRQKPVNVRGLPGPATMLSAGRDHACAIVAGGKMYCWGNNTEGQLGNGSLYATMEPVRVEGLTSKVISIAAAGEHTCALVEDGTVLCWGDNLLLQLGITGSDGVETPTLGPKFPKKPVALTAGFQHTCALLEDRSVECWGRGTDGQLGGELPDNSAVPMGAIGLMSAVVVRAGENHSCALLADGAIKCWGKNDRGQLGAGDSVFDVRDPAVAVGAGGSHACGWLAEGALKCWGNNASGQLGIGTRVSGPPGLSVDL